MDDDRPVHRYRALEKWVANKVRALVAQQPDTVALLSSKGIPAQIINLILEMLVPFPVIRDSRAGNWIFDIGQVFNMIEGVKVPRQCGGHFERKNDDGTYTSGRWCIDDKFRFGVCSGDGKQGADHWRPISREWLQNTEYYWSDAALKETALLHAVFFDLKHQAMMQDGSIAQDYPKADNKCGQKRKRQ